MKRKLSEEEVLRIFENYRLDKEKMSQAKDFLYSYFLPLFDERPFRRLLKDEGLRLDAYVEAIEKLVKNLKGETKATYEHRPVGMKPYFCEIFEKKCIDIIRREKRRNRLEITYLDQDFLQNLSDNNYENIIQYIRTYLDSIPFWKSLYLFKQKHENCFHILLLRYLQGFSIRNVAEILKKTEKTVKTQSSGCLKKFKLFNQNNHNNEGL